jgi:tellurite resistance protein TerC
VPTSSGRRLLVEDDHRAFRGRRYRATRLRGERRRRLSRRLLEPHGGLFDARIFAGVGLIQRFHWVIYLFGLFLVYTGVRLLLQHGAKVDPEKNPVLRFLRRIIPVTDDTTGKFFVRRERLYATPLLLVLLMVETTDLIFALDSIPAVLSITLNTFIVYTSNIFAILGLRSLFFALSSLMDVFNYLHHGISCILIFVGFKMLLSHYYEIRTDASLAVIAGILLVTIVASVLHSRKASKINLSS